VPYYLNEVFGMKSIVIGIFLIITYSTFANKTQEFEVNASAVITLNGFKLLNYHCQIQPQPNNLVRILSIQFNPDNIKDDVQIKYDQHSVEIDFSKVDDGILSHTTLSFYIIK